MPGSTPRPRSRRLSSTLWLTSMLALVLVACTPGPSVSLTLAPTGGTLSRGGSLEVQVTLNRAGGASGDVALSLSGLPAGVDGSFSPATLSGGATTSTLTLSAEADAVEGAATLTVAGTGAGLTTSAHFALEVAQFDVNGRVVGTLSQPLAGITVMIEGHPSVVTGADGAFTFSDVTLPYTITIASLGSRWANAFVGLTAAEPELFSIASVPEPMALPTATVEGELDSVVPPDHRAQVCVEGIGASVYGCGFVSAGSASYSVSVNWLEGNSAQVRLRALEVLLDADFDPVSITGAGASPQFTLTEGGTSSVDLVMGGAVQPVTFTVNVAPTYPVTEVQGIALTHLSDTFTLGIGTKTQATSPVTARSPFFSGASYTVVAGALTAAGGSAVSWRKGLTAASTVTLAPPEPPTLTSPADAAAGVGHATDFVVGNPDGGVMSFFFTPRFMVDGPQLAVTTTATTVSIPDLSAIGLGLPPGEIYNWAVYASPEVPDMDAAVTTKRNLAGYVELAYALSLGGPEPTSDGSVSLSEQREFTLQ